jgi:hypothetical protein
MILILLPLARLGRKISRVAQGEEENVFTYGPPMNPVMESAFQRLVGTSAA